MDRYKSMRAFVQIAGHEGFAPAARELGLSTSAISRQMLDLEDWLDLQLLNRTTRHVSLTEAGREHLERCKDILAQIDQLESSAKDQPTRPHGKLRITAPVFMGKQLLGPLLPGFLAAFPDIRIELQLLDRVVNLVDEGFDLALRIGSLDDSTMIARKFGEFEIRLVAAPHYLERAGTPRTMAELKDHNCLIDTAPRHGPRWTLRHRGQATVRVDGNIAVNSGEMVRELALDGVGIAFLPHFFVANDIKAKTLVPILGAEIRELRAGVFLVYPFTRHPSGALRAFVDHVVEHAPPLMSAHNTKPVSSRSRPASAG